MSDFTQRNAGSTGLDAERTKRAQLLQDAIGDIRDEFIEEAHADAPTETALEGEAGFSAVAGGAIADEAAEEREAVK